MWRNPLKVLVFILFVLGLVGCIELPSDRTVSPTQLPLKQTIVSLTFDDGNADNFSIADSLKANGISATFYIPSGLIGHDGFMTWEQLRTLQDDGNEIGGHTLDHQKIQGLDTASLKHQICDDRMNLINHGFDPISFAYPFGNYDEHAVQMVQYCGYLSARTIKDGPQLSLYSNPYVLKALPYIVDDTDLSKMKRYVGNTRKEGGGWVILIFHHVCDGCDYFSVKPDVMAAFIAWLNDQQERSRIQVETIGQVILSISN